MEVPAIVDFDPGEDYFFPRPVSQKMNSKEYMALIKAYQPKPDKTALWFLGQNTWILKAPEGLTICIDPYLTDFCASGREKNRTPKSRLLPIFIEPEDLDVDIVAITHSHADHCDPYTLERLGCKSKALFIAPWQAMELIKQYSIPVENQILIHPLQEVVVRGVKIIGAFAEPTDTTDLNHLGFVFQFSNSLTYYNSGDTAKSEVLEQVKAFHPDVMSVCINGGYHNLSPWEAAEICKLIQPRLAVPAHFDMMPHNIQSPHMFRKALYEKAREVAYLRMEYYRAYEF